MIVSYSESGDGTIYLDDGTVLEPLGEDEVEPWLVEVEDGDR